MKQRDDPRCAESQHDHAQSDLARERYALSVEYVFGGETNLAGNKSSVVLH